MLKKKKGQCNLWNKIGFWEHILLFFIVWIVGKIGQILICVFIVVSHTVWSSNISHPCVTGILSLQRHNTTWNAKEQLSISPHCFVIPNVPSNMTSWQHFHDYRRHYPRDSKQRKSKITLEPPHNEENDEPHSPWFLHIKAPIHEYQPSSLF